MSVVTQVEQYEIISLGCCGFRTTLPEWFLDARRRDGKSFYCPNCGGNRIFPQGKTEAQKLREELATAKQRLNWAEGNAQRNASEAAHQRRKAAAARGLVTKLKNKAAKGECPCCGQVFPDLHAHITSVHPEFVASRDNSDVLVEERDPEALDPEIPLTEQVVIFPRKEAVPRRKTTGRRAQCPHCQGWYKNQAAVKSHVARQHPESA